jgi:hypothetical protein
MQQSTQGFQKQKNSLANFSSRGSLLGRAEVLPLQPNSFPVTKESQNGLESTKDRRSAVRHGNQHVCERNPQVSGLRSHRI